MEPVERELVYYQTRFGKYPFQAWYKQLKDRQGRLAIDVRLARLRVGNFGVCSSVGQGVLELKISLGPGYRVYFGLLEEHMVLLLAGGDKSSQWKDIRNAIEFWRDHKARSL